MVERHGHPVRKGGTAWDFEREENETERKTRDGKRCELN